MSGRTRTNFRAAAGRGRPLADRSHRPSLVPRAHHVQRPGHPTRTAFGHNPLAFAKSFAKRCLAFPAPVNHPNTDSEPAPAPEAARWFADEVRAHDAALRAYLHGSFPAVRTEVEDVIQESYLRTWKARATQPILSARNFLFRVARNLALDMVRHNQASPIDRAADLDGLPVVEDMPDAAEAASRQDRVALLAEAMLQLPGRCREVFILHKIKQLSRREVATRLGLSERTVEAQTARAVRRCADYLRKRGVNGLFDDDAR